MKRKSLKTDNKKKRHVERNKDKNDGGLFARNNSNKKTMQKHV